MATFSLKFDSSHPPEVDVHKAELPCIAGPFAYPFKILEAPNGGFILKRGGIPGNRILDGFQENKN